MSYRKRHRWVVLSMAVSLAAALSTLVHSPAGAYKFEDCTGSRDPKLLHTCGPGTDCGPLYCYYQENSCPGGQCDPEPCKGVLIVVNLPYATCTEPFYDACLECERYYCGSGWLYQGIDIFYQCQTMRCSCIMYQSDACIPEA